MSTRDVNPKLRAELKRSRDKVDRLRKQNAKPKAMLEAFSVRPAATLSHEPPKAPNKPQSDKASVKPPSKRVADARVQTFRSLFRGHDDVYAVRWESKKGKSGYSPACAHEWDPLICKKPHGKCTDRRYLPLSDDVGRLHRAHEGKREARVYDYVDGLAPMLSRMYAKRVRGYTAMGSTTLDADEQMTLLNRSTEGTNA